MDTVTTDKLCHVMCHWALLHKFLHVECYRFALAEVIAETAISTLLADLEMLAGALVLPK
jgi:hypothetical protein